MEIYTLVGMRNVDYTNKNGKHVQGWNLYFTYEDPRIAGVGVEDVYIGKRYFDSLSFVPELGHSCQLVYNKFGDLSDIVKA